MRFIRDNGQRLWRVWGTRAGHLCGKPTEKFRALVCVCVFLSISPVHLCFDLFLSCFPINYLISFRPLGPAMASSHITYHTRLGGGVQQFETVHSSNRRSCPSVLTFLIPTPSFHRHWVSEWAHTHSLSQSQTRSYDHRTSSNYHHQYPNPKKVCIIQPVPMEVTHTLFEQSQFSKWLG